MTTITRKSSVTRTIEVTGEHQILDCRVKDIVAYRVCQTEQIITVRRGRTYEREQPPIVKEGICKKADLDKVLAGKVSLRDLSEFVTFKRDEWASVYSMVKRGFLNICREQGWYRTDKIKDYTSLHCELPLTALENHEDVLLVESAHASHDLFDAQGAALPVARRFGYIDGSLDNGHYDLEKAATILMARDDVRLLPSGGERGDWSHPQGQPETDPKHWIGSIPGYNAERGRDRCLAFMWMPTPEDAIRFQAEGEKSTHGGRGKICWDLDMFGLRKGGAALFSEYHQHVVVSGGDRNDEYGY